MKSGNLNFLEPSGPLQACNGTALPLPYNIIVHSLVCKSDNSSLRIFERKILRKIYGPVQEGGTWRIRYNEELNRFIKGKDIVKFIKAQTIRCLGHVKRMQAGAMPRRMMEGRLFIGRSKGRPRLTLRLLMSYIYGAPSKARNANVVYIWTYVWQR